jgi:dTDP-4-amino-4,6-dideoxygalactose transaminase
MNTHVLPLATNGRLPDVRTGKPTQLFAEPLCVGRPNLGDKQKLLDRFEEVLDRGWLTNDGPNVRAFESEIARYLDVRHCIAVSNATIGLQIAIAALGLSGEVVVPSFTFPATAHALAWQGITPVFCDVDPLTHNIDPVAVERLIGPKTTAILGVHLWGNPCAIDALSEIANRHRLSLLFDAAHAFGCSYNGRMIGNFGRAEVFSFHATKFLSTGEGGAIATNDDDLANKMRRLRNFGIQEDQVVDLGINGKMSELAAVMGLTALESREEFIARNHSNVAAYDRALTGIQGVKLFSVSSHERQNYQYVVVEVSEGATGMSRDRLVAALHAENVLAKRYFYPGCHRLEPYRSAFEAQCSSLPHTERLCERLMQLPTGMAVSEADIARIGDFLRGLTEHAKKAG